MNDRNDHVHRSQRTSRARVLAQIFGTLFLVTCLLASVIAVGLPGASRASSDQPTIKAAEDTYATSSAPGRSYAGSSRLEVRNDPRTLIFLKFAVQGYAAGSISNAHLRLYSATTSRSPVGLKLYSIDSSWSEGDLTWQAQPALGAPLAEIAPAPIKNRQWVDFDLGAAIGGDGVYSFAIASDSNERLQFRSTKKREAPQLVLTLAPGAVPGDTSQPTTPPDPADDTAADADSAPDEDLPPADPNLASPDTSASLVAAAAANTTVLVQPATGGYLGSTAELAQRNQLAAQGVEPYKSAVADAIKFANSKLSSSPAPQEPLNISGTTGAFVDDTAAAYGLALGYAATGNARYAQKARDFIMAWVTKTKTTKNTCPNSGSCQTSLIIGRVAPGFVFAANLIRPSGAFSTADDQAFRTWLRTVILPTASVRTNNWGDAGTFMRAAVTDYLGDAAGFSAALTKWKQLVDLIAADGHIPEETRRGSSGLNYTQEALDYKIAVAVIAQRRGVDLWSYGRFKLAVDYAAKYVVNPSSWPWASGASASIHPLWEIAYQQWRNPAYQPIIKQRRPYGSTGHSAVRWVTLTNGIPF